MLFGWMDWDEISLFNPEAFESALAEIKTTKKRPGSGKWAHHKGASNGWSGLHQRQEEPVDQKTIQDLEDFLDLGKQLRDAGKHPRIYISY